MKNAALYLFKSKKRKKINIYATFLGEMRNFWRGVGGGSVETGERIFGVRLLPPFKTPVTNVT